MTEEQFIQSLTRDWNPRDSRVTGVGDDCAVIRRDREGSSLLMKTDAVVEGVHFLKNADGWLVGRKALARAVSDMAAMGGVPLYGLVTLGLPKGFQRRRILKIYQGITALALKWKIKMVGGETTRCRDLLLSISLVGETQGYEPLLRSTAKPGDEIWVTGVLGNTRKSKHFLFDPRIAEGKWLAEKRVASAMMDLSDGLGADLPKLARASGLGFDLDLEQIPRSKGASLKKAFQDGEDYELLFTVPSKKAVLLKKFPFSTPLRKIGVMKKSTSISSKIKELLHGYDHLQKR